MKPLLLAATLLATALAPAAAFADSPQHLVDSATLALEDLLDAPGGQQAGDVLRRARAVVICPNIFRAGFVFGGEGGGCVMVARGAGGGWSDPAFYSLGSGSFGFQIGVQSAEVLMMIMTSNGLNAVLNSQVKLGGDAGLTVATLGAGVNGSMSAGLTADILTVSKSQGLYGGLTISGSIFAQNAGAQQAYYGTDLNSRQIIIDMAAHNPGANPLRAELARYGG
jgi:lipid-binding SYLF domain-containing protein